MMLQELGGSKLEFTNSKRNGPMIYAFGNRSSLSLTSALFAAPLLVRPPNPLVFFLYDLQRRHSFVDHPPKHFSTDCGV